MKYIHAEVYDVLVFDENSKLVAKLDSNQTFILTYDNSLETYLLFVKDAMLNTDFLKFIGKENNLSDYDKLLNKQSSSISITKNINRNCKIIAKTIMIENESNSNKEVTIEIPLAKVIRGHSFVGESAKHNPFDVLFEVVPVDEEFFKIHI